MPTVYGREVSIVVFRTYNYHVGIMYFTLRKKDSNSTLKNKNLLTLPLPRYKQ